MAQLALQDLKDQQVTMVLTEQLELQDLKVFKVQQEMMVQLVQPVHKEQPVLKA